jgi:hypothetical protein
VDDLSSLAESKTFLTVVAFLFKARNKCNDGLSRNSRRHAGGIDFLHGAEFFRACHKTGITLDAFGFVDFVQLVANLKRGTRWAAFFTYSAPLAFFWVDPILDKFIAHKGRAALFQYMGFVFFPEISNCAHHWIRR